MSWENFIAEATDSYKKDLSEVLEVSVEDLPEDDQKTLSVAICLVKRNEEIRADFKQLRVEGMKVREALYNLQQKYHLHPDHIKNIAYKK